MVLLVAARIKTVQNCRTVHRGGGLIAERNYIWGKDYVRMDFGLGYEMRIPVSPQYF